MPRNHHGFSGDPIYFQKFMRQVPILCEGPACDGWILDPKPKPKTRNPKTLTQTLNPKP